MFSACSYVSGQPRDQMGKNHKHRKLSGRASVPTPPPANDVQPAAVPFSRDVCLQLLAIVVLSCVLGFAFNAASPVGIQFGELNTRSTAAKADGEVLPSSVNSTHATTALLPPWVPPVTNPSPPPAPATTPSRSIPVGPASNVAVTNINPVTNRIAVTGPLPGKSSPLSIHWPEAKSLVAAGQAVLVDVRQKPMYDAGHIPGAVSLPEVSPPSEYLAFLNQQSTNMTVIVYCSSTSCSQSARVANRLVQEFRWPSVRYMTGGYLEYQQAERAAPAPPSAP